MPEARKRIHSQVTAYSLIVISIVVAVVWLVAYMASAVIAYSWMFDVFMRGALV